MSVTRELISEFGYEESIVLDPEGLDDGIIGISHDGRVVYSYNRLIAAFMEHEGMTYEEAVEWIDYNTLRAIPYMGEFAPIIMTDLSDYED